jgi:hypothetical protein
MRDQVLKRWIIVKEPSIIPLKKVPKNSDGGAIEMLKELRSLYPEAVLILVELAYGDDLWLTDGDEAIRLDEIVREEMGNDR